MTNWTKNARLTLRHVSFGRIQYAQKYIPCFCREILPVHGVWPYTLDYLEDLVANVELVIELRVGPSTLTLNVELHQCMQQVLRRKVVSKQGVTEHALESSRDGPYAMVENRD